MFALKPADSAFGGHTQAAQRAYHGFKALAVRIFDVTVASAPSDSPLSLGTRTRRNPPQEAQVPVETAAFWLGAAAMSSAISLSASTKPVSSLSTAAPNTRPST